MSLNVTRSEALSYARIQYQVLAERALRTPRSEAEREAIRRLAGLWDAKLAWTSSLGSEVRLDDETVAVLVHLAGIVGQDLPEDAVTEWLDAFPDAVADLFPPSAVTYRLEDGAGTATPTAATTRAPRRKRQPKLALAA